MGSNSNSQQKRSKVPNENNSSVRRKIDFNVSWDSEVSRLKEKDQSRDKKKKGDEQWASLILSFYEVRRTSGTGNFELRDVPQTSAYCMQIA